MAQALFGTDRFRIVQNGRLYKVQQEITFWGFRWWKDCTKTPFHIYDAVFISYVEADSALQVWVNETQDRARRKGKMGTWKQIKTSY